MTSRIVLLTGLASALVAAAPAQAATLTADKACYQEREPVRVVRHGLHAERAGGHEPRQPRLRHAHR